MQVHNPPKTPIICVGVVCWKGDQVLVIKRATPPLKGQWSIPGGKVIWGESLAEAALRELYEETGIKADLGRLIGIYEIIEPDYHYVLIDYCAQWLDGVPMASDDASEAQWVTKDEALTMVDSAMTCEVIIKSVEFIG